MMCLILPYQRLYKEKGVNDQHSYTITSERPEITQAKINAANFSEVLTCVLCNVLNSNVLFL